MSRVIRLVDAYDVLCAQLTRDLFAIAKFLLQLCLFKSDLRQYNRQPSCMIWAFISSVSCQWNIMLPRPRSASTTCDDFDRYKTPTCRHWSYNPASLGCCDIVLIIVTVLADVPLATLAPLQRVQNAAARLIFELPSIETILLQVSCSFTGYQYAGASSISCAASCTLFTPEDARLVWRTLYNSQPPDSHVLIYGLRQHQHIHFRGSRPSSVSLHSHTLVRPCRTHCLPTSATFLTRTLSESF